MSLTLELDPATERKLKSAASKNRTTPAKFALATIKSRLYPVLDSKPARSLSIATLLEEISRGMTEDEWTRYAGLISKRRMETLTPIELAELHEFSERLECLNARRMELVAELARRRRTSLEAELKKLGIGPRHV